MGEHLAYLIDLLGETRPGKFSALHGHRSPTHEAGIFGPVRCLIGELQMKFRRVCIDATGGERLPDVWSRPKNIVPGTLLFRLSQGQAQVVEE